MYLVISLLFLRAGCGIWLYQFLIIAHLFTLHYFGELIAIGMRQDMVDETDDSILVKEGKQNEQLFPK